LAHLWKTFEKARVSWTPYGPAETLQVVLVDRNAADPNDTLMRVPDWSKIASPSKVRRTEGEATVESVYDSPAGIHMDSTQKSATGGWYRVQNLSTFVPHVVSGIPDL
jgi:hypothetical protein